MTKAHLVSEVKFQSHYMILSVDNTSITVDLMKCSPRLLNATLEAKSKFEISPSGYGIHWPLIDEDLSIDGLIRSRES